MGLVRKLFFAATIPTLVVGMVASSSSLAFAQSPDTTNVPSVGVQPVGSTVNDPNKGQWFIAAVNPTQTARFVAHVTNIAPVEQTVAVYLTDVLFNKKGVPQLVEREKATDVGTWSAFAGPTVKVPARGAIDMPFTV